MGLFGGGNSSSSTSNESHNIDHKIQTAAGSTAVSASGGSVVNMPDGGTVGKAFDSSRRTSIKNVGANPVAIGGAGLTFANAAVLGQTGETWNESEAAGAAWSAMCDAGLASTLNIQTIACA